jgi:hypothetical protein
MSEPTPATPRQMLIYSAIAAAIGVYFGLVGLRLLPIPGGSGNLHAPLWLVFCIGLVFVLAAGTLFIQGLGHANAAAELPAAAPQWMRIVQFLVALAIFVLFGLIATWVAFGPGEREFSGSVPIGGPAGDLAGRIVFGFGAVITWLGTLAVGVYGFRKFMRRSVSGTN